MKRSPVPECPVLGGGDLGGGRRGEDGESGGWRWRGRGLAWRNVCPVLAGGAWPLLSPAAASWSRWHWQRAAQRHRRRRFIAVENEGSGTLAA